MREYCDIFFSASNTAGEPIDCEELALMHALNHVIRSDQIVSRGNAARKQAFARKEEPPDTRDSSLTKPRVLIIAPMRNVAYRCVQTLLTLHGSPSLKSFKGGFSAEYGGGGEEDSGAGRRRAAQQPADFQATFRGNTDDNFMVCGLMVHCVSRRCHNIHIRLGWT